MAVKIKDQTIDLPQEMIKAITEAVGAVDVSKIFDDDKIDHDQLNIWIAKTSKQDFINLQRSTNKKFGKAVQLLVTLFIEKAKNIPLKAG
jgi:hypothetical protein